EDVGDDRSGTAEGDQQTGHDRASSDSTGRDVTRQPADRAPIAQRPSAAIKPDQQFITLGSSKDGRNYPEQSRNADGKKHSVPPGQRRPEERDKQVECAAAK